MSAPDHDRSFVRPLVQAVQSHGGAFAEILARRAETDADLARHLLTALDAVALAFPEVDDPDRPHPVLAVAEADTASAATFSIPADVAKRLHLIAPTMENTARRLERLHSLYGEGEQDIKMDDGEVVEWTVSLDHSEVERLIANTRNVAQFSDWLAQFAVGEHNLASEPNKK